MTSTRIVELARIIQENTIALDEHFRSNGLPTPSFDEDGPIDFGLKSVEAQRARQVSLEATKELQDLLLGPTDIVRPMYLGISLQAIARYDIATKVPLGGEISFADLSKKCGIDEISLRRILRYAMFSHRCFREPRKGFVAHTAASANLARSKLARSTLGFMFEECWPAYPHTLDALEKFKSDEQNPTGWSLSHNTDLPMWEFFATHPERATRAAESMASFGETYQMDADVLSQQYPWNSIGDGRGTVADVGGSSGHISIVLARAAPGLKFIVQDRPSSFQEAEKSVPADVADRIVFMGHDFFKEQPVKADAYLFRQIFHNWSDTDVIRVLKATVPALRPGAKVIVNDGIMPEPGELPRYTNKTVLELDMTMMSMFNTRERDRDDWHMVFEKADKRFKNIKVWVPEGYNMGVMEATWEG